MTYQQKKQQLIADFLELRANPQGAIGLGKSTSNVWRNPSTTPVKRLDVRGFNQVISVDAKALTVEAEGMISFEDLVDATLQHDLLPLVVPELKTITLGGGISGLAIESSSFAYGLVHESVLEMDVLLASGEVVTCTPTNTYSDLFYAIPNSYGTLGYVLRVKAGVRRAAPYVRLQHLKFDNAADYFRQLEAVVTNKSYDGQPVDFIDGAFFSSKEMYLTLGFDSDTAPHVSDYTYKQIYYKSIKQRSEDYLTTHDYIWRWDTDWFWCSRFVFAENPLVRRLLGKQRLGSKTYAKMMRFGRRSKVIRFIGQLRPDLPVSESVIQDAEIPVEHAAEFLAWFTKTTGISPVWVCPTKATAKVWRYPLYPMDAAKLYINFGFWDAVPTTHDPDAGYFNQLIETKVRALGGMKSLYSSSFYEPDQFKKIYNDNAYQKLKKHYDPDSYFKTLYQKTVQKPKS